MKIGTTLFAFLVCLVALGAIGSEAVDLWRDNRSLNQDLSQQEAEWRRGDLALSQCQGMLGTMPGMVSDLEAALRASEQEVAWLSFELNREKSLRVGLEGRIEELESRPVPPLNDVLAAYADRMWVDPSMQVVLVIAVFTAGLLSAFVFVGMLDLARNRRR